MNRRTFVTSALAGARLIHSKLWWCDFSPVITAPAKAARRVPEVYLNWRLHNFVVGAANLMAVATVSNWANDPKDRFTPLVIYGGAGTGKSHLAHAAFNEIVKRNPRLKAHRIDAWHFFWDMEDACRQGAFVEFMRNYKSLDFLLIDGVQFLKEAPSAQAPLQSIFNTLQKRGRRMVFVTGVHPKHMHGLSESLKSRLCSGLAVALGQPDLELRRAILEHYASTSRLEIQPEALDLIATRVKLCPRGAGRMGKAILGVVAFLQATYYVERRRSGVATRWLGLLSKERPRHYRLAIRAIAANISGCSSINFDNLVVRTAN